jgi:hypothetical protein
MMSIHTHKTHQSKRIQLNQKILKILRTVPYEKGFHFYMAHGNYTGETATSLDEFEMKIQVVPAASIDFHLDRGDFQKWIGDTLGDTALARRVTSLKLTMPAEDLRKEILAIVQTRISELRRELPHHLRHRHA